jgi:dTMP kinase
MMQGKFITFEGGDGVGKSTQIERLARRLSLHNIQSVLTREPGGTPFAERVREFILGGELPPHSALAEAMLFAAARQDHVEKLIRPALGVGNWVLCDRFADSTRAYQGAAGGVDHAALLTLEGLTHGGTTPDLTLVLDLDPMAGRQRIAARKTVREQAAAEAPIDPFETRGGEFQRKLRQAFLDIARSDPKRCVVIDASQDVVAVDQAVWAAITARYGLGET